MAITKSLDTNFGMTVPAGYIRIVGFRGTKQRVLVEVDTFYDSTAASNDSKPITSVMLELLIPNGATMAEMYEALKLLPEFQGATDC